MLILALLNTGDGSGLDEGPVDCAGLRNRQSDGMCMYDDTELSKGPVVGTGNGIKKRRGAGRGTEGWDR